MAVYHCGLLPDHWMNSRKRYVRVSESLGTIFGLPIASEYLKKHKVVINAGISKFRPLTYHELAALKINIKAMFPFTEPLSVLDSSSNSLSRLGQELEEEEKEEEPQNEISKVSNDDVSRVVHVLNKHLSSISTQLQNVNDNLARIRANIIPKSKVAFSLSPQCVCVCVCVCVSSIRVVIFVLVTIPIVSRISLINYKNRIDFY
jgi:hypothetical protein